MTVDDLARAPAPADGAVWVEVDLIARSVDRQLECLRSILAAADEALADGPLGDLVRGTSGYVAGRSAAVPADGDGATAIGGAVIGSLAAISALAARSLSAGAVRSLATAAAATDGAVPHRIGDLVGSIVDEVLDRYRMLVADLADERPAPTRSIGATAAPLELHVEQLGAFVARAGDDQQALGGVVQLVGTWLLISAHVAEARVWVQARRILEPPGAADPDW